MRKQALCIMGIILDIFTVGLMHLSQTVSEFNEFK